MVISPLALRRLSWAIIALLMFIALFLAWTAVQNQESTLAIRPVNQGASVPDGFIIAQQDDDSQPAAWLSRLRDTSHRFG